MTKTVEWPKEAPQTGVHPTRSRSVAEQPFERQGLAVKLSQLRTLRSSTLLNLSAGKQWLLVLAVLIPLVVLGFVGRARPRRQSCPVAGDRSCVLARQLQTAYGVQPLLVRGITGRGQTVTIVARLSTPATAPPIYRGRTDLRLDLKAFDSLERLPPASVVVSPPPGETRFPLYQADTEEVTDVEMVHAIAPGAAIRVSLFWYRPRDWAGPWTGDYLTRLMTDALRDGNPGDVISISESFPAPCATPEAVGSLHRLLRQAASRHVTVVASSGDFGAAGPACVPPVAGLWTGARSTSLPASDPLVTAVGGTALTTQPDGGYRGETSWNQPPGSAPGFPMWPGSFASGGGFASQRRPSYQTATLWPNMPGRGLPDVAADSSHETSLVTIFDQGGQLLYGTASGTSASAPLWAGIVALADQYARRRLGFINPMLYRIGRSREYADAFHDITSGNNNVVFDNGQSPILGYQARPGWDPVTGWGSPRANHLVPLLAATSQRISAQRVRHTRPP